MKTTNLLLFCAEAGFAFLIGRCRSAPWTGIAAFETRFFAVSHCGMLRRVTFCANRKSPKSRTGRGCFDSPSPCEPSPATTEVGLRSPFWNPLRLVQCLTLPTDFFAKINLVQKTTLVSRSFAIFGRNRRETAHGFSSAVQGWGFKRGGENAIPAPFVILCILSVHTESMPAERVGSETLRKGRIRKTNAKVATLSQCHPPARCKFPRSFAVQQ